MNSKKNKLVVVTGGTRGIGRGIVERLSMSGYEVVFTYSSSDDIAKKMEADAEASNYRVCGYRCDAGSLEAVDEFAKTTLSRHGIPYALINNVGITQDALLMSMSPANWHDVINTNINSVFYMTNRFLPRMMESGDGCILQMSSVSALKGNRGQTSYAATKAALIGFSKALSAEVARFNIRVNAVAPGFIATEMVDSMLPTRLAAIAKNIPLKRLGHVNDVAGTVEFLLSPDASYITGQTFVIDGGITA